MTAGVYSPLISPPDFPGKAKVIFLFQHFRLYLQNQGKLPPRLN